VFHELATPSICSQIRKGRYSGTSPSEFEASFEQLDGRKGRIYVRYVGDGAA